MNLTYNTLAFLAIIVGLVMVLVNSISIYVVGPTLLNVPFLVLGLAVVLARGRLA